MLAEIHMKGSWCENTKSHERFLEGISSSTDFKRTTMCDVIRFSNKDGNQEIEGYEEVRNRDYKANSYRNKN